MFCICHTTPHTFNENARVITVKKAVQPFKVKWSTGEEIFSCFPMEGKENVIQANCGVQSFLGYILQLNAVKLRVPAKSLKPRSMCIPKFLLKLLKN